ncbi:DNA-invertase hin (plasmid) [Corynebacterium faecale]|uniref:recombinase family protein n=1 Tax=Corynebacterium faecale TaxID=1758466 RepID=UPI0025B3F5F7|nr:recombinase family protein [Corynebacterium faecale]WJY93641.1 DNA-invertase hin [Corynebacterium faecale]
MKIGYARCSTTKQDLRAQREQLVQLGVSPDRIYVDHGYTGRNRARPGLQEALAAVREGDTLVVTKLDRLARSVSDASEIAEALDQRGIALQLGQTIYDNSNPMGKMFFSMTAIFAEFEADLISQRTKEGMAIARDKGRLKGRPSQFTERQQKLITEWLHSGEYTQREIAELMSVHPSTISRFAAKLRAKDKTDVSEKLRPAD